MESSSFDDEEETVPQESSEVIIARRTESIDAKAIEELIVDHTIEQFGSINIVQLIEKANLSVTLTNEENQVLGFAGFFDYPFSELCEQDSWESWVKNMEYDISQHTSPLNSLFLHYFVTKEDYSIGCACEIVRTVFNAVPELHYIFITIPKDVELEDGLLEIFEPAKRKSKDETPFILYVCHRHDHFPVLHVRKAVVEDHDDVLPIFKRLRNTLLEKYGEYFLAEMIEAENESNKAVVAEVGGRAVGFMSLCSDINVDFLQTCFELDPFHGFCKPHPDDILEEKLGKIDTDEPPPIEVENRLSVSSMSLEVDDLASTMSVRFDVNPDVETTFQEAIASSTNHHVAPIGSQSSVTSVNTVITPKLSEAHMSGSNSYFEPDHSSSREDDAGGLNASRTCFSDICTKFMPTYFGKSNVFSIQLFCIEERFEMRSADFLSEVFKLFPDKDMVVITVPRMVPEFPLIQHFVRVTPRPTANVPHELYVFHRHGLFSSKFKVRRACSVDYPEVEKLVQNIELKDILLLDLHRYNSARRDDDGTAIQAFVADCMDQVVGICIFRNEEEMEQIRSRFNVEDFIYFNHHRRDEHGHLYHFTLNPIFQHYAKYFMKEVLRLGEKSCLFYPVYPESCMKDVPKKHSLITGLSFMVPIRSRQLIEYPLKELGKNAPSKRVIEKCMPYALNHINRKLTLEPKVTINVRIVVVGASDVGIAFLENLCFCPHLRFNNLILVSKRGLPETMHSTSYCYTQEILANISLRSWVNVVQGTMVAVDRLRKQLVMADDTRVTYDYLILCTGQQFQIPALSGADVENGATNRDLPKYSIIRIHNHRQPIPENVFTINSDVESKEVKIWASKVCETLDEENPAAVVVYGRTIESFQAIEDLLSCGIFGGRLVLVMPPATLSSLSMSSDGCSGDPFNEPVVSSAVKNVLAKAEVRVLEDHVLADWETEETETGTEVVSLSFTTARKPLICFPCLGLICLHPRRVDCDTFFAANDSCLVFDGRLAIDSQFRTNDPYIRAAGSLTKYTRRYYADSYSHRHENYSSREVGFRLAMTMLPLFDPTLNHSNESNGGLPRAPSVSTSHDSQPNMEVVNIDEDNLLPVYIEPKITFCRVPGGFLYLHARKPGERASYTVQLSTASHGRELVTGTPQLGNYFRVHLNQYRRVETITCLVKPEVVDLPVKNILRLYGMHARCLNNMEGRYDEGLIPDLYSYLRQPWAMALLHDRFPDFKYEIRHLLTSAPPGANNVPSVDAHVRRLAEEDLSLSQDQKSIVKKFYNSTGQKRAVEARLLSFISYNYYHLPMYASPELA